MNNMLLSAPERSKISKISRVTKDDQNRNCRRKVGNTETARALYDRALGRDDDYYKTKPSFFAFLCVSNPGSMTL